MSQPEECRLIGALVGLIRCIDSDTPEGQTLALIRSGVLLLDGTEQARAAMTERLHSEKARLVPDCAVCPHPCGRHDDADWSQVEQGDPEIFDLKSAILGKAKKLAQQPDSDDMELCQLLFQLGEDLDAEVLKQFI
jgi:hydroxylamine reductase